MWTRRSLAQWSCRVAGKLQVSIDRDECISCGQCWSTCPDFFEENPDDTHSQVIERHRVGGSVAEGEAPEELRVPSDGFLRREAAVHVRNDPPI